MAGNLYQFCVAFSLRRGTILIAIVELVLSIIMLFLLLLASAHAQEMATLLRNDITEQQEEFNIDDSYDVNLEVPQIRRSGNEYRLHAAEHVALAMVVALYACVTMVALHLIGCILLLYGAVVQVRQLLIPWMGEVMVVLIVAISGLLVCLAMGQANWRILGCVGLCIMLRSVMWHAVYNYYQYLLEVHAASCSSILLASDANNIKATSLDYPMHSIKPSEV